MSTQIDRKMFNKTIDARIKSLNASGLEIANTINILKGTIIQKEIEQQRTVGKVQSLEEMKETFGKKDKKPKDPVVEKSG